MPQKARRQRSTANELSIIPESQMSASSALSRPPFNGHAQGFYQPAVPRSPAPPASSYSPSVSKDLDREPQPTPDAEQHFAYSTTLRRHHHERSLSQTVEGIQNLASELRSEGPAGLWQRAV